MIISRAGWKHKLHVRSTPAGGLVASLVDRGGKPLGVFCAMTQQSFDAVLLQAQQIHNQLLAMHEANKAAVAARGGEPEVTLNHSSEFSGG
jgi:hypothetical protein